MSEPNDDSAPGDRIREPLTVLAVNKRGWHHPRSGGSEVNLRETLTRLAERGHDVRLLCGRAPGAPATDSAGGVEIRSVGPGLAVPPPLDVVLSYLLVTVYFHLYVRRVAPDVVYTVNTPLPWLVVTRRPRVAVFHHLALETFFETHPFPGNWLGYLAQRFAVVRERRTPTVCVSPSTADDLAARGHPRESLSVVRNGLDVDRYSPGEEAPEPTLVFVGGLERYKGVDRLPDVHRAVERAYGDSVRLEVAGRSGRESRAIERYCERTDSATFHGYVSEERKVDLLGRGWVFVAPSRVEGWNIAVLEANACGTPAVGADVKGLRDSIRDGETGVLADADDPAAFAAEVARLLDDDERRARLAAAARDWAAAHSWRDATVELEAVFYEVTAPASTTDS